MYTGEDHGTPSLVLEAAASQDLWIWHALFGVAGSNNDINVLDQSPIFNDMLSGAFADVPFTVNGREYKFPYYLCDGIYPSYATIVKAYRIPDGPKQAMFTKKTRISTEGCGTCFWSTESKMAHC